MAGSRSSFRPAAGDRTGAGHARVRWNLDRARAGDADREVVDERDRVGVPPEEPIYALRRIWLSPRRSRAITTASPMRGFGPSATLPTPAPSSAVRLGAVPARQSAFCRGCRRGGTQRRPDHTGPGLSFRAAASDGPGAPSPSHGHHLLAHPVAEPRGLRICPWREEILEGLLGSTILGFHTRFHCNNFIDTVDRLLESRIDREYSTISYQGARA